MATSMNWFKTRSKNLPRHPDGGARGYFHGFIAWAMLEGLRCRSHRFGGERTDTGSAEIFRWREGDLRVKLTHIYVRREPRVTVFWEEVVEPVRIA